ncbi:hypothetical protein [Kitasatospora sp. NPDC002965]|uniref:hypothetical protein n=1 Tax=Kitasatospora sp. NPDC002965 TaxID=3154775 RepID=UPI0033A2F9C1
MKRLSAVLAGVAALAALTGTQSASAVTAPTGPVGAVVTCGSPGAPGFLQTRACIEVTGNQVRLYGHAYPTNPSWVAQNVGFRLSGNAVSLPPLPPITPNVLVPVGGRHVGDILITVPCGTAVTAEFSVDQFGWPPSVATASTVVTC